MKRLIVIAAALLTLTGVSIGTATASGASVCQPNGAGCTNAGTYPGPNAVISNNYTGFKVIWTKSVVQPYSSGVPLYWTAYMTYTNIGSSALTLGCPGSWANASYVSEYMSGGSGDDGTVSAENTTCSQKPGLAVSVAPGGTYTLSATFHNVPWPGSAVSITWGGAGTSPNVNPFPSSASPAPGTSCQYWYVLSLHGLNEAPGNWPEFNKTFQPDVAADHYSTEAVSVSYPELKVNLQDAVAVFKQGLSQNLQAGVAALQAKVEHYISTCPSSLISLYGFSEGAWIINLWEQKYPDEAKNHIRNAALLGDPCYVDLRGDAGLARLFTSSCGSAFDYEYNYTNIEPTDSVCLNLDPICGSLYFASLGNTQKAAQVAAAIACGTKAYSLCAHSKYVADGDVAEEALWITSET